MSSTSSSPTLLSSWTPISLVMRCRGVWLVLLLQHGALSADFYSALGVNRDVDAIGLKKAYRQMALHNHPDKQHDKSEQEKKAAADKFLAASNAFEVLSVPEKRRMYDRYGEQRRPEGGHARGGGGRTSYEDPFKLFEAMFGGAGDRMGGSAFMDSSGRVFMRSAYQPPHAQAQRQSLHVRQQQHAKQLHARAAQAHVQAQFDAEARAHAEAQYAQRRARLADSDPRRSKVLDL